MSTDRERERDRERDREREKQRESFLSRFDLQKRRLRRLHVGQAAHGRRRVLVEPLHDAVARHGLGELAPVQPAEDARGQREQQRQGEQQGQGGQERQRQGSSSGREDRSSTSSTDISGRVSSTGSVALATLD